MSVNANIPLGSTGSASHIPGTVPEHRISNEDKNKNAQKRRRKLPRSPKRAEDVEGEQPSPDSENKEGQGQSIDYLA